MGSGIAQEPALLERERELAALSEVLASARDAAGAVAMVEGPAGIGKSSLLTAACDEAEAEGMEVLRGRGLELERDASFGVAIELFAPRLASATAAERDRLFHGQAGLAASLLDARQPPDADSQALVRGLYWLAANLAARPRAGSRWRPRGLVIAIDDTQWCDRPSMAFVAHLAARLDGLAIALVLSQRTGEPATAGDALDSVRGAQRCSRIAPGTLSESAVATLLATELPGAEPEFVAACARVTGGNPFMTRELARALRADGVPATSDSVARVERLVPDAVLRSVLTRLGRLGEPAQRLAAAVAVLGDRALLRHAIVLAELGSRDGEEAADSLAAAGILDAGEPLRFAHPLIATAVHSDLPAFARARAHRAAAGLLAADGGSIEEICAHLLLATPEGDAWTVATLREAARRAVARGDPRAAARLLERALVEPVAAEERGDLLIDLAEAEALLGDAGAEARVKAALEVLDEPSRRARALRTLSRLRLALGDHAAAAESLRDALADVDPADGDRQGILAEYLTVTRFRVQFHAEAKASLEPVIEAARRGSPPDHPGLLAHLTLDLALGGEDAPTVRDLAARATADDPLVDPGTHGMAMGMIVQALCCVDELELAERIADAALAAARRRGSLIAASLASYHRAIPRYHRGALADALADLDQAQAPRREGWAAGAAWPLALQAHTQLELGDVAAAAETLAETTAPPESMDEAIVLFARGRLALAQREPRAALAHALAAGRCLADGFEIDHPGFLPWRHLAARAAMTLGDRSRAADLTDEARQRARWAGVPRARGLALRTAAAVAEGERRVELLLEAADAVDSSPSTLERAHILAELGGAIRRDGRRTDATAPLREALQLADSMGAAPLAEAARQELRETGARPRRAAHTGVDSLTPAERRVSQLAARGLTNAQIAQDLFVTTKTVETHLAHAYRKLEITSRRQLPTLLGEDRGS